MKDELVFNPGMRFDNGVEVGFAPINPQVEEVPTKASFGETLAANFRQYNLPYRGAKKLFDADFSSLSLLEREEGYDPIKEGLLSDIPRDFYMRVLSQKTRKDAQIVRANIFQELEDYKTASRSGLIANMTTSFGATLLDPTMLVPVGHTIKYLDATKGFLVNFGQSAAKLGAFSAAQNAFLVASKETQGLSDWVMDTTIDTFVAAGIGGAMGAFASKGIAKEMSGAKAYFKASDKNLDIVAKISEKGEFEKFEINPAQLEGIGAAQAKDIEALLNSGQVSFKNNPYVKHIFGLGSPIVRGVTSDSPTVRGLTTDLWGTNFRTSSGVLSAIQDPGAYDFVRSWQGLAAGLRAEVRSAYLASVGVSGLAAEERASIGAIVGKYRSELDFNEEVGRAYRRGFSDDPNIQRVINSTQKVATQLWEEAKKRFPELKDETFTSIKNHLIRIYNKDKIQALPDEFADAAYGYLAKRNQRIATYNQRFANVEDELRALKTQYNALLKSRIPEMRGKRKELKAQIENKRREFKQLGKQRLDDIRSGALDLDMLEERPRLTTQDKRAIDVLNKPRKKLEAEYKKIEKEAKAAKGEAKIALKEQLKAIKEKIKAEKQAIKTKIINGEIEDNLLYTNRYGKILLKNPNKLPELRSVKTPEELRALAEATRDTIQQLNEEQMIGALFGRVSGNTPSSLKARTFLWNDADAEPWLINDITTLMDVYIGGLSKYLHGHDIFKKYGISIDEGKAGIARALKGEYELARAKILEEAPSEAREKALGKLRKDLDKNTELVKKFHDAYFGSLVDMSSTPYKVANAIRQFTSSVLLTNMPILMLTEFFTPTFKIGYKEFIHDGLVGTVSKMQKFNQQTRARLGDAADGYLKGYYTDCLIGANRLLGQSLESKFGYGQQYYQKSWYQRFSGATSKLTDTLSQASRIMDGQEVAMASMSESRLFRILDKFTKGEKLLKEEISFLDEARINPNTWGRRIMQQFEKSGEMDEGGYISNFHLWDDFEASQRVRIALDRHVRSVITKPGPADVPFIFKDPIGGMFFQFLSWPFAATQNFLLPMITEPEMQKFIGFMTTLSAASLISPLRQLAKGEEVDVSFEALSSSALSNSGLFGWQYDVLSRAIAYMNFAQLRDTGDDSPTNKAIRILLPERHRGKGLSSLIGSPALGVLDMFGSVFSSLVSGEFNQADGDRAIRLTMPWLYNYGTQRLLKKAIAETGLPETRAQARNE